MNVVFVLCAVFSVCFAGHLKKISTRIVGGSAVDIKEHPWQASLKFTDGSHTCGASVLSAEWVMTAAHCFNIDDNKANYQIRVGVTDYNSTEGQTVGIVEWEQHPDWGTNTHPGSYEYDIALIKVSENMEFNDNVKQIKLVDSSWTYNDSMQCFISGWGQICASCGVPNTLQAAEIKAYTNAECENYWINQIDDGEICVGNSEGKTDVSACYGDSGGPFSCGVGEDAEVAGITSWGTSTCDGTDAPSVYTRVAYYRQFVRDVTGL